MVDTAESVEIELVVALISIPENPASTPHAIRRLDSLDNPLGVERYAEEVDSIDGSLMVDRFAEECTERLQVVSFSHQSIDDLLTLGQC